jgi:CubicO group peptidase (beta-lactamase class C family)
MKDDRYKIITIKQLLNHTSGMPDVQDYEWEKNIADEGAAERYTKSLADSTLISEPGKEFHYSNIAFDIMADLIAKVSQKTFEAYVKDNILAPLAMTNSSFFYPETDSSLRTRPHTGSPPQASAVYPYNRMHAPSSTLNTSAEELAHWAIANLNEGKYNARSILQAATLHQMMTPTFLAIKEHNVSIGLSWFSYPYRGSINVEHGGGDLGYRSMLTLIPEKKLGIVVLCNHEDVNINELRDWIRDVLL